MDRYRLKGGFADALNTVLIAVNIDRQTCLYNHPCPMANSNPAERLLEVADRLFYEQGYGRTGINQIIAEAEVAKASFYQHFPSKEQLAVAYLKRRHCSWFKQLRQIVQNKPEGKMQIFALFDFLEIWLISVNFRGCAFLNMSSEQPALGTDIRNLIAQHKAELRIYIHHLAANLGKSSSGRLADTVLILFEGAIVEAQITHKSWPVAAARTAITHLLEMKP